MKRKLLKAVMICSLIFACVFAFATEHTTAYAAESVVKDVLKVRCQVTAGTTSKSTKTNLRLVSSIDTAAYEKAGFEIVYKGKTITHDVEKAYSRIVAKADGDSYNYNPKVIDTESKYFITATLANIANANFDEVFTIRPYVVTYAGETMYGVTKLVKVSDSYNNLISIPAEAETGDLANALTVKVGDTLSTPEVRYDAQSKYANLLIADSDFPSVTKMTVMNGEDEYATVMHRNLTTTYTAGTTGDQTWYTAYDNTTEEKYVIVTEADLYGFAELSKTVNFSENVQKTIFLGADIELYEGNASAWATAAPGTSWSPIGQNNAFAGIFDGFGSEISGLYLNYTSGNVLGLFGRTTANATIKDMKLMNSYLNSTGHGYPHIGSIVGVGKGKIDSVYSEAIVKGNGEICGGLIGLIEDDIEITNCCFAGSVESSSRYVGGIFAKLESTSGINMTMKNCLMTGSVASTYSSNWVAAGGIGGRINDTGAGKCVIEDCLVTGSVRAGNKAAVNSVIGRVLTTTELKDVYTTNDAKLSDGKTMTNTGNFTGCGDYSSNVTGNAAIVEKENLIGYKAETNANGLDYTSVWVMKGCGTPELKKFSTEDILMTGDIEWYESNESSKTYTITTKEELFGFTQLAQTESFSGWTISLGNDITINTTDKEEWARLIPKYAWHPIGRETAFAGTFNGNGYTISGIYLKTSSNQIGLFGETTEDAVVENFKLTNSYFESTTHATPHIGSVIGNGGGQLSKVYSDAVVVSTGEYTGGLIGYSNKALTIDQCWFDGSVSSTKRYVGGILGGKESLDLTVQHCLNTGDITSTYNSGWAAVGGLVGRTNNSEFVLEDSLNMGTISVQHGDGVGSLVGRTLRGTSGTLTVRDVYTIDNITYEGGTIGTTDTFEGFGNYSTNSFYVDGQPTYFTRTQTKESSVTETDLTGLHARNMTTLDFTGTWNIGNYTTPMLTCFDEDPTGYCDTDISWYDENKTSKTYTITTKEELYGLAQLSHLYDFNGWTIKLGNDITINEGKATDWATKAPAYYWEAIGRTKAFKGTFDGQGNSIVGLYSDTNLNVIGLFGRSAGTIKNVSLENSYLRNDGHAYPQTGSIVGIATGTIKNVYSNAIMDVHGDYAGGIVGRTEETGVLTIAQCWYDGQLTSSKRLFGGIMGSTAKGTITIDNCLNTGSITSTITTNQYPHIGGIIGAAETTGAVLNITNCVSLGKIDVRGITVGNSSTVGAIVGRYADGTSGTVSDNYYTTAALNIPISTNSGGTLTDTSTKIVSSHFNLKTATQLTGAQARYNTALDFYTSSEDNGVWVARNGKTLALKAFVPNTEWYVKDEVIVADTSWYDSTKTTHTISTTAQMVGFSEVSKNDSFHGEVINLEGDIYFNLGKASDWATKAPINEFGMIGSSSKQFCGTFNGNGHTISGMFIDETTATIGLFEETHDYCTVQDFSLINSFIRSASQAEPRVGSIAGQSDGDFNNIYSNAIIVVNSGNFTGGLLGRSTATCNITNCWFDGSITSVKQYIGGILGVVDRGTTTIKNCLNTGTITSTHTGGFPNMGGICSATYTANAVLVMENCLNTGKITSSQSGGYGSLLGHAVAGSATFTNCYATEESCWYSNVAKPIGHTQITVNTTSIRCLPEAYLKGTSAASWTTLDFDNVWAARDSKFPALKKFIPEDEQMDLTDAIKADTSWSTQASGTASDPYRIADAGDLHGLALMSYGQNFSGKTFIVTNNITVNTGVLTGTKPTVLWLPIGQKVAFAGTFGGQSSNAIKTISGLYVKTNKTHVGLFGQTAENSKIQNISLKDSYFESTYDGGYDANVFLGSIVGLSFADLENVYSNATVIGHGRDIGGLIGRINNETLVTPGTGVTKTTAHMATTKLTKCWFDGKITSDKQYVGGIAGELTQGVLEMKSCLFTGTLTSTFEDITVGSTKYEQTRAGGFIGYVQNTWTKLSVSDSVSTGTINDSNNGYGIGTLIGRSSPVNEGLTFTKVYATAGATLGSYADGTIINGTISEVQSDDRFIGYNDYLNGGGLDFSSTWTLRKTGVPALKIFVPSDEVYTYTDSTSLVLSYWGANFASLTDMGVSNYVLTATDTGTKYTTYASKLVSAGFTKSYENSSDSASLSSKGVYNAVYTKADGGINWVVTLVHAGNNTDKTWVSVNTGKTAAQALSAHMTKGNIPSYSATDGYTATSNQNVKLVMRELYNYGNSFIIQLQNGHFIINDGGTDDDMRYLVDDLYKLTNGKKPIIEAWTITHLHYDHSYIFKGFTDHPEWADKIYVEAIYLNEPSAESIETDYETETIRTLVPRERKAVRLLKTTKGDMPNIYRYQTGQRFYFKGVTMDVVQAQEQIPVSDYASESLLDKGQEEYQGVFNTTSTGLMFTITDGTTNGKKVYIGGDQTIVNMNWIMNSYNASLFTDVNVFAAFHHGYNTRTSFTQWMTNNYARKIDVVLLSAPKVYKDSETLANNYANKYYTYANGNVTLTFTNSGITSSTAGATNWSYH